MNRMLWSSRIQWSHDLHLWLSQPELLIWIQMWIKHPPILGKSQSTCTWSGHTCCFYATKIFPFCRAWDVLRWLDLGWTGKVPVACQLELLPWFLLLDLDLRFIVRYLEVELKFLVEFTFLDLFCNLIAWLPCTGNGSIKKVSEVAGFLNRSICLSRFVLLSDCVVTMHMVR